MVSFLKTNMEKLLKYTYLMDVAKIKEELYKLWDEFRELLTCPTWENLNEARAINYLLGQIYCEKIALEAIERRLGSLDKKMTLLDFLIFIDGNSSELPELRRDKTFATLEEFYRLIKDFKKGDHSEIEETFIKLYNQENPSEKVAFRNN